MTEQTGRASLGRAQFDRTAEERSENEGMIEQVPDAVRPAGVPTAAGTVEGCVGDHPSAPAPPPPRDASPALHSRHLPVEGTDLERRVLAHERILQALIAHMAETEPQFVERLHRTFGDSARSARQEHDYVDTESYAAEFIEEVVRLATAAGKSDSGRRASIEPSERLGPDAPVHAPGEARKLDSFKVSNSGGIWRVGRNERFFGHFLSRAEAQSAISAALPRSAAAGRAVSVSWPDGRKRSP